MAQGEYVGPMTCRHCGNTGDLLCAHEYRDIYAYEDESETPFGVVTDEYIAGCVYRLLKCGACRQLTLDRAFVAQDYVPEDAEILYPPVNAIPTDLPQAVAREYAEALKQRWNGPNAYTTALGRALEAVCDDQGVPSGKLMGRLRELITRNKLTAVEGFVSLRNIATHADAGSLLEEDVPVVEGLLRYILEHLYVIPALNAKAQATALLRRKSSNGVSARKTHPAS